MKIEFIGDRLDTSPLFTKLSFHDTINLKAESAQLFPSVRYSVPREQHFHVRAEKCKRQKAFCLNLPLTDQSLLIGAGQ
jgi:hypothetical protein